MCTYNVQLYNSAHPYRGNYIVRNSYLIIISHIYKRRLFEFMLYIAHLILNFLTGIRDVPDWLSIPSTVSHLHHPLGPASTSQPPSMEGEAERKEPKAFRDFQTRVVREIQKRPTTFAKEASSKEDLGLARPRDVCCRPYLLVSIGAYALILVIYQNCVL